MGGGGDVSGLGTAQRKNSEMMPTGDAQLGDLDPGPESKNNLDFFYGGTGTPYCPVSC